MFQNFKTQYKKLYFHDFCIDVNDIKNNSLLVDGKFIEVYNFVKVDDTVYIIGKELLKSNDIYLQPITSSQLSICCVTENNILKSWLCSGIESKLCKFSHNGKIYVFPLLHTYATLSKIFYKFYSSPNL